MDAKGIRAFAPMCGLCGWVRLSIRTKSPVKDFKFVNYRVCDWCDRGNKGKRDYGKVRF